MAGEAPIPVATAMAWVHPGAVVTGPVATATLEAPPADAPRNDPRTRDEECWGRRLGCKKPCDTDGPAAKGEAKDSRFCKNCKGSASPTEDGLFVPADQARIVPIGACDDFKPASGPGLWKSETERSKRFRLFNYLGRRWHEKDAILVYEKAEIARHGDPIPQAWCKEVDGVPCVWLKWCNRDFQPVSRVSKDFVSKPLKESRPRNASRKRKTRPANEESEGLEEQEDEDEGDGEGEGDGDGEREGESEGDEDEGESDDHYSPRATTDRQKLNRFFLIEEKQKGFGRTLLKLQTEIKELQATTKDEKNVARRMLLSTLRRLVETALFCIGNYYEATRGDAGAAEEMQGARFRSLGAGAEEPQCTCGASSSSAPEEMQGARFCSTSAGDEEPGLQFTSCTGAFSVTEEQGSSVPPEGAKLLESLKALAVAGAPPQLQQLHEEYKALYHAVIDAA